MSAYAVKNVTIQRSIIAEALNQSVHDKGEHSYAAIWGGVNLSIHHNLIASHKSRNPKIGTSETVAMTQGYTDDQTLVDMKNNVIYNWGDKAGYGTETALKHTYRTMFTDRVRQRLPENAQGFLNLALGRSISRICWEAYMLPEIK